VIGRDMELFSLCEHQLVLDTGELQIRYIPNNRVLALSLFPLMAWIISRPPLL
ncbi:hypothetical protein HOY82DRAFT_490795, partial [Tuber indicum]